MAVAEVAELVVMTRTSDDSADLIANGDDFIFPDIDGEFYADPMEHWKGGQVQSMTIHRVFNIKNELFNSNIQGSLTALRNVDGIAIEFDEERIRVTLSV